jgi:hypothetical protein
MYSKLCNAELNESDIYGEMKCVVEELNFRVLSWNLPQVTKNFRQCSPCLVGVGLSLIGLNRLFAS